MAVVVELETVEQLLLLVLVALEYLAEVAVAETQQLLVILQRVEQVVKV
jgi:hypothetical protein